MMSLPRRDTGAAGDHGVLGLLRRVADIVDESPEVDAALPAVLEALASFTGWPWAHALGREDPRGPLVSRAWHAVAGDRIHEFAAASRSLRDPGATTLPGRAIRRWDVVCVADLSADPLAVRRAAAAASGVRGAIACPVLVGRDVWGVLELFTGEVTSAPDEVADVLSHVCWYLGKAVEREREADALRENASRLRSVLDGVSDAVAICDADGRIREWNGAAEELLGWERAQILGMPFAETILEPGPRESVEEAMRAPDVERGRKLMRMMRVRARRADGCSVPVELTLWPQRTRTGCTYNVVLADRTAEEKADVVLREAEDRWRMLAEAVPDEILTVDLDGVIVYWNRPSGGYEREQVVGASIFDFVPPDWRPGLRRILAEVVEQRTSHTYEMVSIEASGANHLYLATALPVLRNGRTAAITILAVNVTKRAGEGGEAEERARSLTSAYQREREAVERLRALDEMKNTFLTAVSHELRSPLTGVLGYAQLLARKLDRVPRDEARRMAAQLLSEARKLDDLLKDLLDLDRLTRGLVEPRRRAVAVDALVQGVVEGSGLRQSHEVEMDLEPVVAELDAPQVERIVENLLSNAGRYTPPGTPVRVAVTPSEAGVLIAVEDRGPGVPAEMRLGVFEPFRQVPGAPRASPGTGIGLSLVARFAELHGGRAWVEDRPGGGASFKVLLPGAPGEAA